MYRLQIIENYWMSCLTSFDFRVELFDSMYFVSVMSSHPLGTTNNTFVLISYGPVCLLYEISCLGMLNAVGA